MKVITSKQTDTIDLSEVNVSMTFVATFNGKATHLLTRENYKKGSFIFRSIEEDFTNGNAANFDGTIQFCITELAKSNYEVHAFTDYKEAFKFIAENL